MNETGAPNSGCTQILGRLAVPTSEIVDRLTCSTLKSSVRFFPLLFSILAFGTCDVDAQELHVIIHHDVGVHSCPDSGCRVVTRLPILSRVHVRSQEKPSEPAHGEGGWTYVDTTRRDRASGWILDGHIGYPGRFCPVRSWKVRRFSYCIADHCPEFTFTASGEFTVRYAPCFDGLCPETLSKVPCHLETDEKEIIDGSVHCVSTGNLHRAGEAVRLGGAGSHEFMYFNGRGELCADMHTCQAHREKTP